MWYWCEAALVYMGQVRCFQHVQVSGCDLGAVYDGLFAYWGFGLVGVVLQRCLGATGLWLKRAQYRRWQHVPTCETGQPQMQSCAALNAVTIVPAQPGRTVTTFGLALSLPMVALLLTRGLAISGLYCCCALGMWYWCEAALV
jgi:hypothetical protein